MLVAKYCQIKDPVTTQVNVENVKPWVIPLTSLLDITYLWDGSLL